MPRLKARAVRWLSDEPIPGIVEVQFVDADGMRHTLVDKAPIFGTDLWRDTPYPVDVLVDCEIVDPPDAHGRAFITTGHPWGIETSEGRTEFVAPAGELLPD